MSFSDTTQLILLHGTIGQNYLLGMTFMVWLFQAADGFVS